MRCPKCHYISFDDTARCRNCGFDLTLAPADADVDLPIRVADEPEGVPGEIELRPEGPASRERGTRRDAAATPGAFDLPLFDAPVPGVDDTPLIAAPAPPRPPLAVRRATPDTGRQRATATPSSTPAEARLPWVPETTAVRERTDEAPGSGFAADDSRHAETGVDEEPGAPPAPRVGAALVDLALMGAIDLVVLSFTLRFTGLGADELGRLPWLPLAGFFLLLNGGYLVAFTTASGQSIGKMLFGVRVVTEARGRVPLGQAVVRLAGSMVAALTLGLGLLPVFQAPARRTLPDRLSHTRVIRA